VHRSAKGLPMVDGGVWCNNPVLVAVLEGTEILGWSPEEIRVLSLGCTESPLDCSGDSLPGGLRGWLKKDRLLDLFMSAQSTFATNAARLRLGRDKERLSRITRMVAPKAYALDGVKGIESLEGLGHDAARTGFPQLKEVFFSEKAEAFEPLRKPE